VSGVLVALGDSFTAGLPDDPAPTWVELLAHELRIRDTGWEAHTLAAVGATSEDLLYRQLPAAVELEPSLVTITCGANDVLDSLRPEVEAFRARVDEVVATLGALVPDATVLMATYADFSRFLPFLPRSRRRVEMGLQAVNGAIREIALRHGRLCLDVESFEQSRWRDSFGSDGMHASPLGHFRIARQAVATIEPALDTRPEADPVERHLAAGVIPI
jgi:lysophospholipase L1-like esterase